MKAACFMLGVGGADANGVDSRLLSPLHLVALFNRPDIARVLLMSGASPRLTGGVTRAAAARGGTLWSPLEIAEEACTEGGALDEGERETNNSAEVFFSAVFFLCLWDLACVVFGVGVGVV